MSIAERKILRGEDIYKKVNIDTIKFDYIVDFKTKRVHTLDDTTLDAIEAENKGSLWRTQLNPLGKKLAKMLDNEVHSLKAGLFATNAKTIIKGKGTRGKRHLFTPFMLVFDDGQVLTAQARNVKEYKKINAKKPMFVSHWFLNEQDVTDLIAKDDPDVNTLATRLKSLIEKVHKAFVRSNKDILLSKISDFKSKIDKEIEELEKQLKINRLKQEYDPNLAYSGGTNTRVGGKVFQEKMNKNLEIEKELRSLGADIPQPTEFNTPKSKPIDRKPLYKIFLPKEKKDYVKSIKEAFDKVFEDIDYKFLYIEGASEKDFFGGLGDRGIVSLDAISEDEIEIIGDRIAIKEKMMRIIVSTTLRYDKKNKPKITPENIASNETIPLSPKPPKKSFSEAPSIYRNL